MSTTTSAPMSESSIADARSDSPATRPPRADHVRFVFLDALRGFALVFMVLNHTGRWWQDRIMGWPRYYMIYVTMAVAAPIFLFLVGFCLPLSKAREEPRALPMLWKYAKRGARLILAGLLLNLLVFPEDPIYSNGVLQTIGISIFVAALGGLLLRHREMGPLLFGVALLLYLAFAWSFGGLTEWVTAHTTVARVLFFEFPPWPWISIVLVGLVLGDRWVRERDARARTRYMWLMLTAGVLCFAWLLSYDWYAQTANRWTFKRDYILNNHWTPRGASSVGILGALFVFMAIFYYAAEVRRMRMTWLITLGRTALILYFLHQLIVLTLVNQLLGMRFNNWWFYGVANFVLLAVLLGIGKLWLKLKQLTRALVIRSLLFSFQGRISRSGYWLGHIYLVAVLCISQALWVRTGAAEGATRLLVLFPFALVCPGIVWINLAVLAKRWHDRGKSGWMSLILLVPIVGQLWSGVELGFLKGTKGWNQYGEDPHTTSRHDQSLGSESPTTPGSTSAEVRSV